MSPLEEHFIRVNRSFADMPIWGISYLLIDSRITSRRHAEATFSYSGRMASKVFESKDWAARKTEPDKATSSVSPVYPVTRCASISLNYSSTVRKLPKKVSRESNRGETDIPDIGTERLSILRIRIRPSRFHPIIILPLATTVQTAPIVDTGVSFQAEISWERDYLFIGH